MLLRLANAPRDYAWGSTTLLAELEGRTPSGAPEAEVWFGDHAGSPSLVDDGSGRTLDEWLAAEGAAHGMPPRLPFLVKLLAAGSPLSIQVHPSKDQAEAGFAREHEAGLPVEAGHRNYRDDNHKPELIVAVSERFEALAGIRDRDETLRLLDGLGDGPAVRRLAGRLAGPEPATALRDTIAWLLSGEADADVAEVIAAVRTAPAGAFDAEHDLVGRLADAYPGDAGVVVALLMNRVELAEGEALFVAAGVLHAYVAGLGVELMAASDNVLRGGLTPKHIDVGELLAILDTTPGPAPILTPAEVAPGALRFDPGIPDFALTRVRVSGEARVPLDGAAIVVATRGEVVVAGVSEEVRLRPGAAVLVTPDEGAVSLHGEGFVFVAMRGASARREG
ncbi:mannose-6-phosphate isomerase, class I [Microbacterium sp. X-17]|uniref:mannose-6-phosphate isomerase, class I n=1 Tax=Microbacterium sp. X-17 TaxID=3144404 RepID=UPI0031F4F4CC